MFDGPLIRRRYPLLDDPSAHRAQAAERRWLEVIFTLGRKHAPRQQKAHSKKHSVHFPSFAL